MSVDNSELNKNPKEYPKIKEVMGKHDVTFVHGIHASLWTRGNSLLNETATWEDKLDIALHFRPKLSVSSIRAGDDGGKLFSRMGLVLADGTIGAMYSVDAGTMAENLQHRRLSPDRKQSTLDETLYGTYSQFGMRYNELVIGEPEFAGFYLCSDINDHDTSVVPISEINKELSKRKIPLFILEWGILYTTINGLKTERLVDPKPIVIDPKQNKIEIKRLLSKGVFDIGKLSENNPDLKGAIAFGFGKAAYLDFVENKYNQNYGDSKGDIFPKDQRRLAREGKHLITVAKKSTLIDYYLFRTPTGKERILRFENYLEHNFGKVVYNRIGPSPIAWLGYGNIALRHIDDRPQSHVTALIEAVEQASYKDVVEYDSHCYLAGFAVAAEHFGDNETVSKVLNYLGRERFSLAKESHEKRIGVDGQLTLLESDIFNQPIN